MNPFTMIFLVVAIGILGEVYKHRITARAEESNRLFEDLSKRMARQEERMANIETIVLEKEKEKRFSDLSSES